MSHPLVPHVSQEGALSASDATISDAVSQATTFAMSIIPMFQHLLLLSLVPVVLGIISSYQGRFSAAASKYMAKFRREFIRTIDYTASSDYYFNLKSDNRNNILQKAILMHVSKMKGHRYPDGLMMLVEPSEEDSSKSRRYPFKSKDESSAEILRNMCISTMPSYGVWEVIDPNISLMHTERDLQGADLYERRTLFQFKLKTNHRDGGKIIDAFLDKCMKSYKEMLRRTEDKARYMFQLQLGMSKTEDNGTRPPVFKKYKLSDEKTFDSLFLPRKDETLRLVDDFLKRDGKFSIEGFPQKLGLLLHGPPGTGKTSFVKALATYTGRHIVSVPLGKITTNQELYDIMFEGEYPCIGDDGIQQRFSFNEIIFLIEEIDAASDIVRSRKTRAGQESTMQRYHSSQLFDSTRPPNEPLISTAMKKNPHLNTGGGMARAATMPEYTETAQEAGVITLRRVPHDKTVEPTVIRLATAGSAAAVAAPAVPVVVPPVVGASEGAIDALLSGLTGGDTLLATADKLDLAGLLNVLDGVVDSPGRIVIMTTNHPERLDAALIRPGRINKKLHFGFMQHPEMIAMLSHHYGELKPANIEVLNQILIDKNQDALVEGDECGFCISPAEIEQLCAEADTLEEFFSCLRKFPDLVAHAY